MAEISLRAPDQSDAERLARIWVENCRYYAQLDPEAFQVPDTEGLVEWFSGFLGKSPNANELYLVAVVDGEVLGYLEASVQGPSESADKQMLRELGEKRLLVNVMGVDPAHWRTGLGRALMEAAEDWGRKRGATLAGLDTYLQSSVSVPFYQSLGYERHSINFRKRL